MSFDWRFLTFPAEVTAGWTETLLVVFAVIAAAAFVGTAFANRLRNSSPQRGVIPSENNPHPGISAHKLPVGGGFAGFLFVLASLAFAGRIEPLRYFFALSVIAGIAIALVLRWLYR